MKPTEHDLNVLSQALHILERAKADIKKLSPQCRSYGAESAILDVLDQFPSSRLLDPNDIDFSTESEW